jgi:hypothetical protein
MRVVVTAVEVRSVPFTTEEDERWDLFSGPDLYCEVYGPSGECLHTTAVANDVGPSDLPLSLDATFALSETGPHVLRLLDADLTGDDVLSRVAFAPERLADAGPGPEPPTCIQFTDGETALQLTLSWTEAP